MSLLVSTVLLPLVLKMMNPTQVSLPFKLLLFVAIDGWGLLAQALVAGDREGPRRFEEPRVRAAPTHPRLPVTARGPRGISAASGGNFRGGSGAAGRAPRSKCGGQGFDPPLLRQD